MRKVHLVTVKMLIETDTDAEAFDAVSEILRPQMQEHNAKSALVDWVHANEAAELDIPVDYTPDRDAFPA